MAISRTALKQFFQAFKKPTEAQFAALIDSFVHMDDDLATIIGAMAELIEAQQGNVDDKYMSPYLTKVAIYSLTRLANIPELKTEIETLISALEVAVLHELDNHTIDENNPHSVTKTQIGLSDIPNAKSDLLNVNDSEVLATAKAVRTLNENKQEKSTAMRFTIRNNDTSPSAGSYAIGDIVFVGSGTTKLVYIHNGNGWTILT